MFCAEIYICMKENIQTGNTGISQDKIGTAADNNTVLFCCELKDQLFLSLVNSIMGTEIACRVIQNVVQKSGADGRSCLRDESVQDSFKGFSQ